MLRKIQSKVVSGFSHIILLPLENIEFVLSLVLIVLVAAILVPAGGAVYGSIVGKLIFSALLLYPSIPLVFWRLKLSFKEYLDRVKQRRNKLFFLSMGYTYYIALSIGVQGVWPPHWILYFGLGCISWIAYFRLGK